MKIAILSDIHANRPALAAVLNAAQDEGVERLLACGDFIGYYHAPRDCMELLADWPLDACRGNHDLTLRDPDAVVARYGSGAAVARDTLSGAAVRWLDALDDINDLSIDGQTVRLCHGTPWDPDRYLYPDADRAELARATDGAFALVAYGHTHYPFVERIGGTWLVNPGSVGQQRNGVPGAHWALWDSATNEARAMVTPYDPSETAAEARRRDPQLPYLVDVLYRGASR